MTLDELIEWGGGTLYKVSRKLKISHATPYAWSALGYIPILAQIKIETITNGALKADLQHCKRIQDNDNTNGK